MLFLRRGLCLICVLFLIAACNSKDEKEESSSNPATADAEKPTIKFVVNAWVGSEVNVEVARYLLENELGYPTEAVTINSGEQWEPLSTGEVHVNMEVWTTAWQENLDKYIDQDKTILDGTDLGVIGKTGWYIPTYLLRDYPELATWEGFLKPENAALFATEATVDKGQFTGGDPDWGHQEESIIERLGMDFEVVYQDSPNDSEDLLLETVDAAYKAEEPVVFYFWTPHWAYILYDLTEVELPPFSDDCSGFGTEGFVCDYLADNLTKIYWSGLPEYAPDAYTFLQNFQYTNQDQIAMLAAVQLEGKTAREAAIDWINGHKEVWQQWLP